MTECRKMTLHAICETKNSENPYEIVPYTSGEPLPKGFLKVFVDESSAKACIETAKQYKSIIMPSIDVV